MRHPRRTCRHPQFREGATPNFREADRAPRTRAPRRPGAVVGATVLTVLPQVLTVIQDYEMVVLGAVMMATMIFFPRGVVPTLGALLGRARR